MSRLSWQETKKYWELRGAQWAQIEQGGDPDALQNVCHPGMPQWLNVYYARFQLMAYQRLLSLLPPPAPGARALDIGCGAGRWCRFLAEHGYHTVGVDLQPELIKANRSRYPHIAFFCTSVQDFSNEQPFDLISSVTVIQHNPFEEQRAVIGKLRDLLRCGGYLVILENVSEQAPHVFSRSIHGWKTAFSEFGFRSMSVQRYDYSPFVKLHNWATRMLASSLKPPEEKTSRITAQELSVAISSDRYLRRARNLPLRLSVLLDSAVESVAIRSNIALPTTHCGFLFQAV